VPQNRNIGVFGTLSGMNDVASNLKNIKGSDVINHNDPDWRKNREKDTVEQSKNFVTDNTALTYINLPIRKRRKVNEEDVKKKEETGIIAHAEIEAACSMALLTGKPAIIRLEIPKPHKDKEKGLGGKENEVYRARIMTLVNIIHTKIVYGEDIPIYISTNVSLGQPYDQYLNYVDSRDRGTGKENPATKAFVEKIVSTPPQYTPPQYDITPYKETMWVYGSSWPSDIAFRENLMDQIVQKKGEYFDIYSTYIKNFAKDVNSLVTGRLQELDAISGTSVLKWIQEEQCEGKYHEKHPSMYPSSYTLAQVTDESFGSYQPFVRAITQALMQGTDAFLFAPMHAGNKNMGPNSAVGSWLRQLAAIFPEVLAHVHIAQEETIMETRDAFFEQLDRISRTGSSEKNIGYVEELTYPETEQPQQKLATRRNR
jgi:hypothetical protein